MTKHDDNDSGYVGWAIAAWMLIYFAVIIPSARWLVVQHTQAKGAVPANVSTSSSPSEGR